MAVQPIKLATTAHGDNARQQRASRREQTDDDNDSENLHDHTPLIHLIRRWPFDPLDRGYLST